VGWGGCNKIGITLDGSVGFRPKAASEDLLLAD